MVSISSRAGLTAGMSHALLREWLMEYSCQSHIRHLSSRDISGQDCHFQGPRNHLWQRWILHVIKPNEQQQWLAWRALHHKHARYSSIPDWRWPNTDFWIGLPRFPPYSQLISGSFPFLKNTKLYFLSPDLVKTLKISICLKFSVRHCCWCYPVAPKQDKCKQLSIVKRVAFCFLVL